MKKRVKFLSLFTRLQEFQGQTCGEELLPSQSEGRRVVGEAGWVERRGEEIKESNWVSTGLEGAGAQSELSEEFVGGHNSNGE